MDLFLQIGGNYSIIWSSMCLCSQLCNILQPETFLVSIRVQWKHGIAMTFSPHWLKVYSALVQKSDTISMLYITHPMTVLKFTMLLKTFQ